MEPTPLCIRMCSLNHLTAREVPKLDNFYILCWVFQPTDMILPFFPSFLPPSFPCFLLKYNNIVLVSDSFHLFICFFIYLNLRFLSSALYSIQYPSPVSVWLDLHLSISFFLFQNIISIIVFSIPVFIHSLLAYKHAVDFCVLISYPITFLN